MFWCVLYVGCRCVKGYWILFQIYADESESGYCVNLNLNLKEWMVFWESHVTISKARGLTTHHLSLDAYNQAKTIAHFMFDSLLSLNADAKVRHHRILELPRLVMGHIRLPRLLTSIYVEIFLLWFLDLEEGLFNESDSGYVWNELLSELALDKWIGDSKVHTTEGACVDWTHSVYDRFLSNSLNSVEIRFAPTIRCMCACACDWVGSACVVCV